LRKKFHTKDFFLTDDRLERGIQGVYLGSCRAVLLHTAKGFYLNHICEEDADIYSHETSKLFSKSARTWVLLSHMKPDAQKYFLDILSKNGTEILKYPFNGAVLYLYDLR
jgi:hypothetical protein